MRTYKELITIPNFVDRYRYLKLSSRIGEDTFGFDRYLNQILYRSEEWKRLRREVIIRDDGCDLGDPDRPINGRIIVHHMNPIAKEDILDRSDIVLNPDYLICTSFETHNAIHFGDENLLFLGLTERKANDTCPWK